MRYGLKVVGYDIADYKRLSKVSALLLNYGYRVQKSLFECYINNAQTSILIKSIISIIDHSKDRVSLYPVCMKDNMKVMFAGRQKRQKEYDYLIL